MLWLVINPSNGQTVSRLRPDYFAFVPPNTILLGEAVSTTSKRATREKLTRMARMYSDAGFHVPTPKLIE